MKKMTKGIVGGFLIIAGLSLANPAFAAVDPLLIGGTDPTSTLTLQPTNNEGVTGADLIFQVGNNGATEAMRILNDGKVGIGTSSPAKTFQIGGTDVLGHIHKAFSFDALTGKAFFGRPDGTSTAVIELNGAITDPADQFGINVSPTYIASGIEATGIRINQTLFNDVAKVNGAGLVVEGPVLWPGASYGLYFSGLFRGNHESAAAGGTFTNAASLVVETSTDETLWLGDDMNGTTPQKGIYFGVSKDTDLYRSGPSQLTTDGKLRVSGSLGLLGAPQPTAVLAIGSSGGIPSSGGISRVIYNTAQIPATTTSSASGYVSQPATAPAAFTLDNYYGINLNGITIGSGSTVAHQYGILVASLTQGTTDFGIAIGKADTSTLWLSNTSNDTTPAGGIMFGSSRDTSIYRGGVADLRTTGALTFTTDNAYDIGASGANRPRTGYFGTSVAIGTTTPTSKLQVVGLPVYANNAAAIAGGLTSGAFYRTGADPDPVMVVH